MLVNLLLLVILPFNSRAEEPPTVSEVSKGLMCTCGCSMVLYSCQCGTAEQMRGAIQGMIDQGMNTPAILQAFVNRYDQTILAAPPKKGFNLSAWITPFVALAVASGLIYLLLKRWTGASRDQDEYRHQVREEDEPYLEMLEKELQTIED